VTELQLVAEETFEWFQENPERIKEQKLAKNYFHKDIEIKKTESIGRGLFAKNAIYQNEIIIIEKPLAKAKVFNIENQ